MAEESTVVEETLVIPGCAFDSPTKSTNRRLAALDRRFNKVIVMKKIVLLAISHALVGFAGFALGIYLLPILTAPDAPSTEEIAAALNQAEYRGEFKRDLRGSDLLHWGEGVVSIGPKFVSLQGAIAPGPDYQLYLSPAFVDTEADFERLKSKMVRVGAVKTFENFLVPLPESVDPGAFNTVVVWCESFGEFITAASYR